jgi:hypothetical protein
MEKEILEEVLASSPSLRAAAKQLNISDHNLRKLASQHGLMIKTNKSGKGLKKLKKEGNGKFFLDDILNGKHPKYKTNWLKHRLFDAKLKENKCEECGINEWNGKPIVCELDHVNGNPEDHRLENLRVLCPNCHSQTPTYCGKNKKKRE